MTSSLSRFTHSESYALSNVFFGFWFHTLPLLRLLKVTCHPSTASGCFPVFAFRVSRIDPSVYIHWLVCLGLLFTCSIRCEASRHSAGQSTCEEGTASKNTTEREGFRLRPPSGLDEIADKEMHKFPLECLLTLSCKILFCHSGVSVDTRVIQKRLHSSAACFVVSPQIPPALIRRTLKRPRRPCWSKLSGVFFFFPLTHFE